MKNERAGVDIFPNLTNAAREFIAKRLETIERNQFNDYTQEDMESAQREHDLIESEIAALIALLDAIRAIAAMKHPSIESLLRRRGYGYEADRVANLVLAVSAINADRLLKKDAE